MDLRDVLKLKFSGKSTDVFFHNPELQKNNVVEVPKRKRLPRGNEKNKRLEKRGRKAKPKEEDKIKQLYAKNFIEKVYILEVKKTLFPEEPPFWFFY